FREELIGEEDFSRVYKLEDDDYELTDIYLPDINYNGPDPITTDSDYLVTKDGDTVNIEPLEVDEDGTELDITTEELKYENTKTFSKLEEYKDGDGSTSKTNVGKPPETVYGSGLEIDESGEYDLTLSLKGQEATATAAAQRGPYYRAYSYVSFGELELEVDLDGYTEYLVDSTADLVAKGDSLAPCNVYEKELIYSDSFDEVSKTLEGLEIEKGEKIGEAKQDLKWNTYQYKYYATSCIGAKKRKNKISTQYEYTIKAERTR
ncbi:MAG: hypothetical protein ACOCTT_02095, partial [archaeon]